MLLLPRRGTTGGTVVPTLLVALLAIAWSGCRAKASDLDRTSAPAAAPGVAVDGRTALAQLCRRYAENTARLMLPRSTQRGARRALVQRYHQACVARPSTPTRERFLRCAASARALPELNHCGR